MGYRSEVQIVFYVAEDKDFPVLKLWVDEHMKEALDYFLDYFEVEEFIAQGCKGLSYTADWLKWYSSFPEVQATEDALERFKEVFDAKDAAIAAAFEFVRIGEEDADVERAESGNSRYLLRVNRSVQLEY